MNRHLTESLKNGEKVRLFLSWTYGSLVIRVLGGQIYKIKNTRRSPLVFGERRALDRGMEVNGTRVLFLWGRWALIRKSSDPLT